MNKIIGFNHLSNIEISSLETELNIAFPSDYKEFLKKNNGGLPKDNYLVTHLSDTDDEIVLGALLGINQNENFDLKTWFTEYNDELPAGSLVIGTEYNSGLFIMITQGDEKGIYFWDNAYTLDSSSDESNVYWLANTFDKFLNSFSIQSA